MFKLILFLLLCLTASAQDAESRRVVTTRAHESSLAGMTDSTVIVPGTCYKGGLPPDAATGWHEVEFRNDTRASTELKVNGFPVQVFEPMEMLGTDSRGQQIVVAHWAPTRVIDTRGQERYVLQPGDVCHMVLPITSYDRTGHARWRLEVTSLRPANPYGHLETIGVEGRVHSVRHADVGTWDCQLVRFDNQLGDVLRYSVGRCGR